MSDDALKAQVDSYVDEVWEDLVKDIAYLVEVESVEDSEHAVPGAPYGLAPAEALKRALEIAERLGLASTNMDGYIGYSDLPGERAAQIATIAHTDVVPLGTGWDFDPLKLTRKDGWMVGRGVSDDKGPYILSLYAAHFFARQVKETGKKLPYTLRCIAGSNEETRMADVDYYLEHVEEPRFVFSPDAEFPAICGEKGIYTGDFKSEPLPRRRTILQLEAGTAYNAVPGEARALVNVGVAHLEPQERITFESENEDYTWIIAHGIAGHASKPERTLSAINILENYLFEHHLYETHEEKRFLKLGLLLTAGYNGVRAGIASKNARFGRTTAICGMLRTENGHFVQTIDVRYPDSITADEIDRKLTQTAHTLLCSYERVFNKDPFYIEPDSVEIQTLVDTYHEYTGLDATPLVIGGGTYARKFKRACTFGPVIPDDTVRPDWAGGEHMPNEAASEETFKKALKIYIVALDRLMKRLDAEEPAEA